MKSFEARVHEINWNLLAHAFGSAEDVPYLLINLQSPDLSIRDQAFGELFGTIWHQGTIYSATPYTIPFLFELLDSTATQDKDSLLVLLASIASGKGYYQVHQSIFEKANAKYDKHENELKEEALNVNKVRQAISPRFETLLEQITNNEPEIRQAVARAAAYYPEFSEKSLLKLKQALEVETDEDVTEEIQNSITELTAAK